VVAVLAVVRPGMANGLDADSRVPEPLRMRVCGPRAAGDKADKNGRR
jgi:hypothetical protein